MKYIVNNGQVTSEYDVKIDVEQLQEIIKQLDEKCYRIVNKKIKVAAYSKDEAIKRVNAAINASGEKINSLIEISNGYKDLVNYPGSPFVFDCECLCKQSSNLVYILQKVLYNYSSSLDYKRQNNRVIDLLIDYKNDEELIPYDIRMAECSKKMKSFLDSNSNDLKKQFSLQEESNNLLQEMQLNMNFDFNLLHDLYDKAKGCFEFVLVSETKHYNSNEEDVKVYKLGKNLLS